MNTIIKRSKKKFVSDAFKLMVAAGSIAGTVGVWIQFANKELLQTSNNNDSTVLDFPPLPTVIPLTQVNNIAIHSEPEPSTSTTVRDITLDTTIQNNNTTTINSNSNEVITLTAPAPVTSTRSSKK